MKKLGVLCTYVFGLLVCMLILSAVPASGASADAKSKKRDSRAPSAPTGLLASQVGVSTISVSWKPATDNVGVVGYDVYCNGGLAASVSITAADLSGLKAATRYTVTVKARDAAGNRSKASASLAITTAEPFPDASSHYSLFTVQTPSGSGTDGPYELGMKFVSSQAGQITKIRYYKFPGESGVHTGHLWSVSGALLTSVEFSGETAEGWQSAVLSAPYRVLAGTTYVVSVNSVAIYGAITGGLSTAVTHGPLRSVAGANGVYGPTGAFPTLTYQGSNYFRDIEIAVAPDTGAPTVPAGLAASAITSTGFTLTWTASTDDVGVDGYEVFKDGVSIGETATTSFKVGGLNALTVYQFAVRAHDAVPNWSALSAALAVTTTESGTGNASWPDASNTGVPAGIQLTPSGSFEVTTDGAVIENLDVTGAITVLANNVTIRNVRITSGDYYPIRYFDRGNTGLVVEDCEIIGTSGDVTSAIAFEHYTARRLNIHGTADGLKADADVLIEDCWIHDLSNNAGEHNDCVQSTGGKGVTIRHNSLSGASNAAVQTGDESGQSTEDLVIEGNLLSGGGWTLNICGKGSTRPKNTRVVDNCFKRDSGYGPWAIDDLNPTLSGNVYDDGSPIPFQ